MWFQVPRFCQGKSENFWFVGFTPMRTFSITPSSTAAGARLSGDWLLAAERAPGIHSFDAVVDVELQSLAEELLGRLRPAAVVGVGVLLAVAVGLALDARVGMSLTDPARPRLATTLPGAAFDGRDRRSVAPSTSRRATGADVPGFRLSDGSARHIRLRFRRLQCRRRLIC